MILNELSWLLYLADVSQSASGWMKFFGAVGAIFFAIGLFVALIVVTNEDEMDEDEKKAGMKFSSKLIWGGGLVAFFSVLMSILLPSKDTVYAIAASELGEEILTSPAAKRVGSALEAWVTRQIEGDEEERETSRDDEH